MTPDKAKGEPVVGRCTCPPRDLAQGDHAMQCPRWCALCGNVDAPRHSACTRAAPPPSPPSSDEALERYANEVLHVSMPHVMVKVPADLNREATELIPWILRRQGERIEDLERVQPPTGEYVQALERLVEAQDRYHHADLFCKSLCGRGSDGCRSTCLRDVWIAAVGSARVAVKALKEKRNG